MAAVTCGFKPLILEDRVNGFLLCDNREQDNRKKTTGALIYSSMNHEVFIKMYIVCLYTVHDVMYKNGKKCPRGFGRKTQITILH